MRITFNEKIGNADYFKNVIFIYKYTFLGMLFKKKIFFLFVIMFVGVLIFFLKCNCKKDLYDV